MREREGRHSYKKPKPEQRRRRRTETRQEAHERYERLKPDIISYFQRSGCSQKATAEHFDMPFSSLRQKLIAWEILGEDGELLLPPPATLTLPLKIHTEAIVFSGDAAFIGQLRAMVTDGSVTITAQASRLLPYEYLVVERLEKEDLGARTRA